MSFRTTWPGMDGGARREWRFYPGTRRGDLHRRGGPAVEFANGTKQWFWYGMHKMSQSGSDHVFWSDITKLPGYATYDS